MSVDSKLHSRCSSVVKASILSHAVRKWHPGLEPHQCLYASASTWMNHIGCHAGCQEFSSCCTRSKSEELVVHRWWSTQVKESTTTLNPWSLVALRKGHLSSEICPSKTFFKKTSHLFSIFFLRSSTFYKVVSDTSGQLASHLKFIQVFT